jgi:murein DD-endopeptidase MepM/ murein hydrolase activator NlpD
METRYGHLSRLNVAVGQRVRKGDVIGFVGSTGLSTGPHLHYETRIDGRAVDPLPFIRRR